MPALPVRKKTTDPQLAAEQAAVRAFELAMETGSLALSPRKHPMPPRSTEFSSRRSRNVSFEEHTESNGGVEVSEKVNVNLPKSPPHQTTHSPDQEIPPSGLTTPQNQQAASPMPNSSPPKPPRVPRSDERLPNPSELEAAKKKAQLKLDLHAKLSESLEQRKSSKWEFERLTEESVKRKAKESEEASVLQKSWDTCPDGWKTVLDENGERLRRPAMKAVRKQMEDGTFRGASPSVTALQQNAHVPILSRDPYQAANSRRVSGGEENELGERNGRQMVEDTLRVRLEHNASGRPDLPTKLVDWQTYAKRESQTQPATSGNSRISGGSRHRVATTAEIIQERATPGVRRTFTAPPDSSRVQNNIVDNPITPRLVTRGNTIATPSSTAVAVPSHQHDAPREAFEAWAAQKFGF